MATAWYYARNSEQKGPVATEVLMALVASRQLSPETLVWKKGLAEWVKVSQVPELAALSQVATPKATQPAVKPQVAEKLPESEELRLTPDPDDVSKQAKQPAQKAVPQTKPAPKPQTANWYYARDGQQQGPVTAKFLKEKALTGELLPTDHLWKDGLKDWVTADSLPGLKFPVQDETEHFVTAELAVEPTENSIIDIMNDPSFASAPSANEKPNVGLMSTASFNEKPQPRRRIQLEGSAEGVGYLMAAFLVPIPFAFILAYGYGILRYYVGFYIVWYFSIFMIGTVLSMTACFLFEKARFQNQLVALGYLLFLGMFVLYTAWASTITWAINDHLDELEFERSIYLVEMMIHPQMVFQVAVEISKELESTGKSGTTTTAVPYLILEALFMAAAPLYAAYRRYT